MVHNLGSNLQKTMQQIFSSPVLQRGVERGISLPPPFQPVALKNGDTREDSVH